MAYFSGILRVTVESAIGLEERQPNSRQDPYCIVSLGSQVFRTRAALNGGRRPTWNEELQFYLGNETELNIEIKDASPEGLDESLGWAQFTLAKARASATDNATAPVVSRRTQAQQGAISLTLTLMPIPQSGSASTPSAPAMPSAPYYSASAAPTTAPPQPYYSPAPGVPVPAAYAATGNPYNMPPAGTPYYTATYQEAPPPAGPGYGQPQQPQPQQQYADEDEGRRHRRSHDGLVHTLLNPVRAVVHRGREAVKSVKGSAVDAVRGTSDKLTSAILHESPPPR